MRSTSLTGRNRKLIPVLLGFLVLNLIALAQDIPAAKPETVGLSSDRLGASRRQSSTTSTTSALRELLRLSSVMAKWHGSRLKGWQTVKHRSRCPRMPCSASAR